MSEGETASAGIEQFRDLARTIVEREEAFPGTASIEPFLVDMLRLVESRPAERREFAQEFLSLLIPAEGELILGQPGIVEIFEFCMHDLRWTEVERALLGLAESNLDWRVRRAAERALSAFSSEWENAEIYEKFR